MKAVSIGLVLALVVAFAPLDLRATESPVDYFKKAFEDKEGCFIMKDLSSGEMVFKFDNSGRDRCSELFPPCSTFKIALSAVAFDSGYFKTVDQPITWDGKKRWAASHNRDQTPASYMQNSVVWVSEEIVADLGQSKIQHYMDVFKYGNREVSGNLKSFWLSDGSIRISAAQQLGFLRALWRGNLPISAEALRNTQKVMLVSERNDTKVFGKTGTGCIDPHCISRAGRQLGWFVGVLEKAGESFVFAVNYADNKPSRGFAGPNAKKIVLEFFEHY